MNYEKILTLSQCVFGSVSIIDSFYPDVRLMKINNEIEGQVFLDDNGIPSAVAVSRYLYAFIIPAWHFFDKKGLMLGLGAGIGATMLLTLFPELSLTVVEVSPEVIQLAREYFPLVSLYETQGRLLIIESSAENYVQKSQEKYAFTLLDVFSGDEGNQHNLALLNSVLRISPYFMANIISSEPLLPDVSKEWMWLCASPVNPAQKTNWLLTNIQRIAPMMLEYQLFDDYKQADINVITANVIFRDILSQIDAACFYR